jgi:chemotaxis regulatin CheY-phosphate phosphatase CheZ
MRRTMAGNPQADMQLRVLRQELQEMSACIQQTRREIAALRPDEAGSNWINRATEELDAIVAATEKATSDILQAAEEIQALISRGEVGAELRSEIEARIIAVLTACSFQDITGQRTTKIVGALRYLERRINAMIEIWGAQNLAAEPLPEDGDRRPDAHLLNGPALRGGVTQDQVDELLAAIVPGEEAPQAGADIGQSAIDALFD